jgi:hypothetical protein
MNNNILRRVEQACTHLIDSGEQVTVTAVAATVRRHEEQTPQARTTPHHRLRLNTPNSRANQQQKLAGQSYDNALG